MVTADDVRAIALSLPRAYEALVRDRVKFRVGRIVFLSLSPDETVLGFGYPKEERAALIEAEPAKFFLPIPSDMRYNWMRVRMAAIDHAELEELVIDSWRMAVPKKVWAEYLASREP
ncbi:MmcQ/YjbR family DNA-binding protein [Actinokineospora sp. NPDC004072]